MNDVMKHTYLVHVEFDDIVLDAKDIIWMVVGAKMTSIAKGIRDSGRGRFVELYVV